MNSSNYEPREVNTSQLDIENADDSPLDLEPQRYVLRLYIAAHNSRSIRAAHQLKKLCEERLTGRYELEIIDIHKQPELMEEDQIIAIPTLIKKLPPPLQRLIGDMTNTEKLIVCLDL